MKRWHAALWVTATLIVFALGFGLWMLHTESGLRFTVARLQTALPGLHIGAANGTFSGTIQIENLLYQSTTLNLNVPCTRASIEIMPLLLGKVRLRSLDLEAPIVQIHMDKTAALNASAPSLPALHIAQLHARNIKILRPGEAPHTWAALKATVTLQNTHIEISRLQLQYADYELSGSVDIDLLNPWWIAHSNLNLIGSVAGGNALHAKLSRSPSGPGTPISLQLMQPLQASITIQPGKLIQDFQALVSVPKQDAAGLGLANNTELQAELRFTSSLEDLLLDGSLAINEYQAEIKAARLQWLQSSLQIDDLPIEIVGMGLLNLQGNLPFSTEAPLALNLISESLRLERAGTKPIVIAGTVNASGRYTDISITPVLTLSQQGLPSGRMSGNLTVDSTALHFNALELRLPHGQLTIDGTVLREKNASSGLELKLAAFDPSLLLADWPGEISGSAQWVGSWGASGSRGALRIAHIDGQLRAQPLDLRGSIEFQDGTMHAADIVAKLGSAHVHIQGDLIGAKALSVSVDAPDISILLPDAQGGVHAVLNRTDDWQIQARANALKWSTIAVDTVAINGSIGSGKDPVMDLHAEFGPASRGPIVISKAEIQLSGTLREHSVHLQFRNDRGELNLVSNGNWDAQRWEGVLEHLELIVSDDRKLRLAQPVTLQAGADQMTLSEACFTGNEPGNEQTRFCLQAAFANGTGAADFDIGAMPLSWFSNMINEHYRLSGAVVSGRGGAQWDNGALRDAHLLLDSSEGQLQISERPDLLLGYRRLHLQANFDGISGSAIASTELLPEGRADAKFSLFRDGNGTLGYDGNINLLIHQLDVIGALTVEIVNPTGQINGQFNVQRDALGFRVGGAVALSAFTAEVPSLGLTLKNGSMALAGVPDGLILRGAVTSGDGTLTIDGRWTGASERLLGLRITGQNVRLSNTPELILSATPDLKLERDPRGWNLTGTLDIPKARIQADQVGGRATQSGDVVIVDDPPDTNKAAEKWRANVNVRTGDDVQLKGFGFDGKLRGQIAVRQSSGRSASATGQLSVSGLYNAYGQKLNVTRGELLYAGSPLDEPTINVLAERKVGDSTAGIEITGTARNPASRVYARPVLSESEALALLVTGRPLNRVRGADRSRLSGAALALGTIGGDLLAKNLGLDELGVSSNAGIQGDAFTIGKYLSPKLFVGYGIGLLTRGEVFTVRYLINDHIEVEANVGERQRAAVNYRIER